MACREPIESGHRFCPACGVPAAAAGPGPAVTSADPQRAALEKALGSAYTILRLLGRGGMGAVYLAREMALDRLVAVKVLPPGGDAAGARERFRREARTAARLTHPGIVPLLSFGESDEATYFVMGYVRGESLAARLKREGRMGAEEVRRIVGQVADALDYAHRQGIVHRDVKPDNILIDDESGRPMLTDFGIAKASGAGQTLTEAGSVLGTPHYMSPEQASGAALDSRTDLYSLGVMAFAMLAGRLPFEGATPRDVVLKHLGQEPPPLEKLAPDAPADLRGAISKCLAKDPAARFPDAGSLREALGARPVESGVPESLEEVESSGFWLGVWWSAVAVVALSLLVWRSAREFLVYVVLVFAAIPLARSVGLLNAIQFAKSRGASGAEVLRAALWPPRSWAFWYPRRWRRPGDVWPRLPAPVRRFKATGTVLALWAPLLPCAFSWIAAGLAGEAPILLKLPVVSIWMTGMVFLLLAILVQSALLKRWLLQVPGLSARDREDLMREPTTKSGFWSRPEIARLLLPVEGSVLPGEPRDPRGLLAAISSAVQELTGPLREAGLDALGIAREMAAALEALEREKARLVRDADPAEFAHVKRKLEALGSPGTDEPSDQRQMRELLEKQLGLLRSAAARLEEAGGREKELAGRLAAIWREVSEVRGRHRSKPLDDRESAGRLRALCSSVDTAEQTVPAPGPGDGPTVAQTSRR